MPVLVFILIALFAYLLGSIPTGFLVAKARGVDIRTVGSGNIGATNTFRVLGNAAGTFVLLADALKGFAAVALVMNGYPHADAILGPGSAAPGHRLDAGVMAGLFAVLGHNYTCWLHFKGGKGIATSAGVYVALAPLAALIAAGTWLSVFLATRYVSLASIVAAVALPITVWVTQHNLFLGVVTTALAVLVIAKHRTNLQRLLKGTENRVHFRGKGTVT